MKVTALIPYYNDRMFLSESIESMLNQSFEDFELILINHATTDDCREIAHSYKDSRIIHIDMEKNYEAGTGLIMKKALDVAKGKYIKLLSADDIMYKDGLKILVEYMESHPLKDFAFGNMEYIDVKGNSLNTDWFSNRQKFSLQNDEVKCLKLFFHGCSFLPFPASIIKTEALKDIDLDVCFAPCFDVSVWVKLLVKGYKIGYINKYINKYRIHAGQCSSLINSKKINAFANFEGPEYRLIYTQINDLDLFKKVFCENCFVKTNNITKDDIKFIVYYEMLLQQYLHIQVLGYHGMYGLLQNEETRKYLEEKFDFGIKEFRRICMTLTPKGHGSISPDLIPYHISKNLARAITFHKIRKLKNKQYAL